MALFLIDLQRDDYLNFDTETSRHMMRSLRKQPGDTIHATDGNGTIFKAIIGETIKDNTQASIVSKEWISRDWEVHVACSLIKKDSRFEYFLEKATEIGIHRITPLLCERTLKPKFREDRARKIILSALQQSFNPYVPILDAPTRFEEFVKHSDSDDHDRFIATAVDRNEEVLLEQQYSGQKPVQILIGPEGDFTPGELELAIKSGWLPVSLGSTRLRTETAATMAVQIIKSCYYIKNQTTK